MRSASRWRFVLALAFALAPAAARADDAPGDPAAEARQQYNLGTQAYKEKKYVDAALHFEAAAAQRAHAVTLYTAALAWEQASRPDRACDDFSRALEVPGLSPQQTSNARDRIAALEKTLGTLLVVAPDGYRVQLDGLTEVAAPARLHATAGTHKLLVHAPDKPVEKRDVTLEAGQFTRVEIADVAPAPKPAPPAPAPAPSPAPTPRESTAPEAPAASSGMPLRKTLGFAAVGLGVGTLAAGIVLGTQALDAADAYNATPTHATYDHAQSLQTWTTVAFVAGSVFTAGGLALVLWPSGKTASARTGLVVAPTWGGARVSGAF